MPTQSLLATSGDLLMSIFHLKSDGLSLTVSTDGGTILSFQMETNLGSIPLLRHASDTADVLSSACYPMVPFGNRVKGNRIGFRGQNYSFTPNTAWDPLYLHGDGWLAQWMIDEATVDRLTMSFRHEGGHSPYIYSAWQEFSLVDNELQLVLSVENDGEVALPFGLGWHPHFPLTPETTLEAPARRIWTEAEGWLPGIAADIPADLDFSSPSRLPQRWVNNCIEDWVGSATVCWPERGLCLRLEGDDLFRHAFLFLSDTNFDPDFRREYFCFEPMSHLACGHDLPDLGGLRILEPGERLSGRISLRAEACQHA